MKEWLRKIYFHRTKILVVGLILSILVLVIHLLIINTIRTQLSSLIAKSSKDRYQLNLAEIEINYLSSSIFLNQVECFPKQGLKTKGDLIYSRFSSIELAHIDLWDLTFHDKIKINEINFNHPLIVYFKADSIEHNPIKKPDEKLSIPYSVEVGEISFSSFPFYWMENKQNPRLILFSQGSTLAIHDFKLEQLGLNSQLGVSVGPTTLKIPSFSFPQVNKLYRIVGNNLAYEGIDSTLSIEAIHLIPLYNSKDFADSARMQITRMDIRSFEWIVNGFSLNTLFQEQELRIKTLKIRNAKIDAYRNNQFTGAIRYCASMQDLIRQIPFKLRVDTIQADSIFVRFRVLAPKSRLPGSIFLTQMNVRALGINTINQQQVLQPFKIDMSGLVMNQGKLKIQFEFPFDSSQNVFYCKGSLGKMPFVSFNTLLENSKGIRIKAGIIDSVSFWFKADEKYSNGKMNFQYHNLSIENLKVNPKESLMHLRLRSLLLNNFIAIAENPSKSNQLRISPIYAKRDTSRYFLHYASQSIMSGIIHSLIGEKKMKLQKQLLK